MHHNRLALTAIFTAILSGCVPGLRVNVHHSDATGAVPYNVFGITPEVIAAQNSIVREPQELVPLNLLAPPDEYLVGPGDVLQIVVWDHPELTNPFGNVNRDPISSGQLIAADGSVYFPYVGIFNVTGMSREQIRLKIAQDLAKVVNNPQVDVRVVAYRSSRIQVTGEVKNPGVVTLDDTPKGLLEAINEKGGLSPTASRRSALLIRGGISYEIDIAGLLSGGTPAINPKLKAGDIVHVPDTGNDQIFVLGETNKQGALTMGQQRLTLTEALTKSGGLDRVTANDSGVLIFRMPTTNLEVASVYTLDMSHPQGFLLASEFNLRPRDVVYVKATAFSQYNLVINQFLPTITTIFQVDRLTQ